MKPDLLTLCHPAGSVLVRVVFCQGLLADFLSFEVEKSPYIGRCRKFACHVKGMMRLESSWSLGLVEAMIDGHGDGIRFPNLCPSTLPVTLEVMEEVGWEEGPGREDTSNQLAW